MPSDDIVARLRVLTKTLLLGDFTGLAETTESAADEIERLRQLLGNSEQLRRVESERDEIRRWFCYSTDNARAEAKRRGWDCFEVKR